MHLEVTKIIGYYIIHHVLPNPHLKASKDDRENDTKHHRSNGDCASHFITPDISPRELALLHEFHIAPLKKSCWKSEIKSNSL